MLKNIVENYKLVLFLIKKNCIKKFERLNLNLFKMLVVVLFLILVIEKV